MRPFENDAEVLTLQGLTVENGRNIVVLTGSLDLALDRESLEAAKKLRDCLAAVVVAIESRPDLPQKAAKATKVVERKANPIKR